MLLGRSDASSRKSIRKVISLPFGEAGADANAATGMQRDRRPRRVFRPASTGATISDYPIASTSIMGWPTAGLVSHVSTCRMSYRRKGSQTPRKQRCDALGLAWRETAEWPSISFVRTSISPAIPRTILACPQAAGSPRAVHFVAAGTTQYPTTAGLCRSSPHTGPSGQ